MSTVKSSSADLTLNAEGAGNDVIIQGNGTNTATVTAEGLMQFNSGYGSVATAYGCRAWVNFNGSGTVAIRASGNVSSITDNGTGDYTVNFTTAMPDANYCAAASLGSDTNAVAASVSGRQGTSTTSSYRYSSNYSSAGTSALFDYSVQMITIFR